MKRNLTIKFDGGGTVPSFRIRNPGGSFTKLVLRSGKASLMLNVNTTYKLFWLVVGSPDSKYSISLSTSKGYKVVATRNPIKLKVPGGNAGYGRQEFLIRRSG